MRPLSASECISPAIARTKLILFSPFRKGRTWKLCATAYLCRMGTMFFPFTLIYLAFLPQAMQSGTRWEVSALIAGVLLATALFFWLFYVGSRLQFAFLDMVVNRGEFVAPAWRRYGPQNRSWTGVKILIGTAATLACAIPLAAYFRHLMPLMRTMLSPGQRPSPEYFHALFAGYGLLFLIFGPFYLASSLLSDFIVPSLALEDTGIKEAFRRMALLIRQEPGQFALYTLLKVVLGFGMYVGVMIAFEIVFILAILIVGLIAAVIGFGLHLVGVPTIVLTILGMMLLFALEVLVGVYGVMIALGPVFTFMDAFALYFLGGRYPLLGDMLDRSTPPPAYPYAYPPPTSRHPSPR